MALVAITYTLHSFSYRRVLDEKTLQYLFTLSTVMSSPALSPLGGVLLILNAHTCLSCKACEKNMVPFHCP